MATENTAMSEPKPGESFKEAFLGLVGNNPSPEVLAEAENAVSSPKTWSNLQPDSVPLDEMSFEGDFDPEIPQPTVIHKQDSVTDAVYWRKSIDNFQALVNVIAKTPDEIANVSEEILQELSQRHPNIDVDKLRSRISVQRPEYISSQTVQPQLG